MCDKFVIEQIIYPGKTKETSDYYQDLSDNSKKLVDSWLDGVTFSIRDFYKLRKEVADLHYKKHMEYITSPESETYWAS